MFSDNILGLARSVIQTATSSGLMLTTAESCTGGLISGALTEIPGSSAVLDRSFVTYSNEAKNQMLSVSAESLMKFGAVSEAVAKEMAFGAIANSRADVAVSVTGIAGPGGGSHEKPVGLVWFGVCRIGETPQAVRYVFDDTDRTSIRLEAVQTALQLALNQLG
ncbi:MAG: CinA family protein [Alphaproteobacteria bacterium]|nr:CinA family protein [Alphaproteobacteria bacterium]